MVSLGRFVGPALGAAVTALLFVLPVPYAYAPVVGGLFAGTLHNDGPLRGLRACVEMSAFFLPASTLIALLLAGDILPATAGAHTYAEAMSGSGPRNVVFYAVFAYSYTLYTLLVGLTTGGVIAGVVACGRKVFEPN